MIKKNDFVEIEFSARVKEGEIFDTTLKEEAEKLGIKKKKWSGKSRDVEAVLKKLNNKLDALHEQREF
ncbi:hypothetical protein HYT92_01435 [Candidatus Pacearchaeota archaeon]|nr:hypothetical protein [Candidatus Pacearchaeota archaeon]